jgi:hypothetical protein
MYNVPKNAHDDVIMGDVVFEFVVIAPMTTNEEYP